jgi:hypothetical protein
MDVPPGSGEAGAASNLGVGRGIGVGLGVGIGIGVGIGVGLGFGLGPGLGLGPGPSSLQLAASTIRARRWQRVSADSTLRAARANAVLSPRSTTRRFPRVRAV